MFAGGSCLLWKNRNLVFSHWKEHHSSGLRTQIVKCSGQNFVSSPFNTALDNLTRCRKGRSSWGMGQCISFRVLSTAFREPLPNYPGWLADLLHSTCVVFRCHWRVWSHSRIFIGLDWVRSTGEFDAAVISHQVKDSPSKFHLLLPLQPELARVYPSRLSSLPSILIKN